MLLQSLCVFGYLNFYFLVRRVLNCFVMSLVLVVVILLYSFGLCLIVLFLILRMLQWVKRAARFLLNLTLRQLFIVGSCFRPVISLWFLFLKFLPRTHKRCCDSCTRFDLLIVVDLFTFVLFCFFFWLFLKFMSSLLLRRVPCSSKKNFIYTLLWNSLFQLEPVTCSLTF